MRGHLFAREGLSRIPQILTLLDRNPHSPTYGCFDRDYWHYRVNDYPSGMAQEMVWPLALAYSTEAPDNLWYQQPAVLEWIRAGIRFAARSAHPDGSCDDYFPYERAGGAASFSLLAFLETCLLVDVLDPELEAFFQRRADWLAGFHEAGRLSNHQALILLCLELMTRVTGADRWARQKAERLERVLSWQSDEGWFYEYEGCDPGYLTYTVAHMARYHDLSPEPRVEAALRRALTLAAEFGHPDGSYSGEYSSRNSYNFFPHGIERAGAWMPEALAINDRFLAGMEAGRGPADVDHHHVGHHAASHLLAWRLFVQERPPVPPRPQGRIWLPEAGILIERRGETELYAGLRKGGVFKLFRGGALVASDTQVSLRVRDGERLQNAVAHMIGENHIAMDDEEISVSGVMAWAKQTQMTIPIAVGMRVFMGLLGRFFPNLVRRMLQRMLIVGRDVAPYRFQRTFHWLEGDRLKVHDHIRAGGSWGAVEDAGVGVDQTSIYVTMSRTWQSGQILPWTPISLEGLEDGRALELTREL